MWIIERTQCHWPPPSRSSGGSLTSPPSLGEALQRMHFLWQVKKINLAKTVVVYFCAFIMESILSSFITMCWHHGDTSHCFDEGDWLQSATPPGTARLLEPCRTNCGWPFQPRMRTSQHQNLSSYYFPVYISLISPGTPPDTDYLLSPLTFVSIVKYAPNIVLSIVST